MSIASRLRTAGRPFSTNCRRQLRNHVSTTPTNVSTNGGRTFIKIAVPFGAVIEPGHRDLGLIPRKNRHGQFLGLGGVIREKKPRGAFGGVTKSERKRRADLKSA